ncbi:GspH/FimT family pseudopilin [Marinobacter daqiaonensis]|nr:GspH/FimT family pseudopilin [Marinobacter daqiaonensis]
MTIYRKDAGLTLIELVVVVTIVGIVASLALPSFGNLLRSQQRHGAAADLVRLLNTARSTAISERTLVTVCPLNPAGTCTRNWSGTITAFRDPHRTRKMTVPSQVIHVLPDASAGSRIGSTGIFNYLAFEATGRAGSHIGNILWCPAEGDASQAAQVVVNWGGRVRVARDHDGDGVVEDAGGSPVICP